MKYIDINKKKFGSKRRFNLTKKRGVLLFSLLFLGGLFFFGRRLNVGDLLKPVSVFSQIISPDSLEKTDGRTNILALGVDKRSNAGYVSGVLTDTLMVVSIDAKTKSAVIISIPRDLWVSTEDFRGSKINAAYAFGGVELSQKLVEKVLGLPVHYFVVVDFESFEKAIDLLGGIEVDVERAFDDYRFPKPGFENAEPEELRFEHLHFDAGRQPMDGKTALAFARSRHAEGPEGSDFARIKRQHQVIAAAKDKALSLKTLTNIPKLRELYDLFSHSLETNIGFGEIEILASLVRGGEAQISSYLIDGSWDSDEALLYTPEVELYGGQYVLIPKSGNFSAIHYFVQKILFGSN